MNVLWIFNRHRQWKAAAFLPHSLCALAHQASISDFRVANANGKTNKKKPAHTQNNNNNVYIRSKMVLQMTNENTKHITYMPIVVVGVFCGHSHQRQPKIMTNRFLCQSRRQKLAKRWNSIEQTAFRFAVVIVCVCVPDAVCAPCYVVGILSISIDKSNTKIFAIVLSQRWARSVEKSGNKWLRTPEIDSVPGFLRWLSYDKAPSDCFEQLTIYVIFVCIRSLGYIVQIKCDFNLLWSKGNERSEEKHVARQFASRLPRHLVIMCMTKTKKAGNTWTRTATSCAPAKEVGKHWIYIEYVICFHYIRIYSWSFGADIASQASTPNRAGEGVHQKNMHTILSCIWCNCLKIFHPAPFVPKKKPSCARSALAGSTSAWQTRIKELGNYYSIVGLPYKVMAFPKPLFGLA